MTSKLGGIIESMLFAAGETLEISLIAEILEISEKDVRKEIEEINDFYKTNNRGFKIIEVDDSFQLCTIEENYSYIQQIAAPKRKLSLSPAAMETLSIVAYNQPVTRGSIEYIRGVNSDGPVNKLVERGLIEEGGRLDAPGRPILYVTTDEFLRSFGLSSLKSLPDIENASLSALSDIEENDDEQTTLPFFEEKEKNEE
ncbi:MAG: SMC-Scp complex subunit ScpB [Clostridia bacterium]|nr:SMC-Scp complex subunit ScpB [Clostridia bacterium]